MLTSVNNISFNPYKNLNLNKKDFKSPTVKLLSNNFDCVQFTGKSAPSMYSTVFEYLAAEIFGRNKKFKVDGSLLSASKIKEALEQIFAEGRAFPDFKNSKVEKIKWKTYIPQDVRTFSIDKINEARAVRFEQWRSFLEILQ